MAFVNGYGVTYPQMFYPQPQVAGVYSQQNNQMATPNQTASQQNNFIPVPSEEVARNYPIAPGNSVSFKDEKEPYIYVKSMGYSPLDTPTFEKFRLVREETVEEQQNSQSVDLSEYVLKSELNALKKEIKELRNSIKPFKEALDE